METAFKLTYGAWSSSFKVYTDYGSTDPRPLNHNGNLLLVPGTEVITNDFTTIVTGTDPPTDVLVGFEAHTDPARICELATRRPFHRHVGQRPSLIEQGMHVVVLTYDATFDLESRYNGNRLVRLLRADVSGELTFDEAEAFTGRSHPYTRPVNPHGPYRLGEPHADEFYGLTQWPTASGRWVI